MKHDTIYNFRNIDSDSAMLSDICETTVDGLYEIGYTGDNLNQFFGSLEEIILYFQNSQTTYCV